MEIWKIATFIVVFILWAIGVWYTLRLRLQEIRSKTYVCPKTGQKYMPLYKCRMKNPVSGEWLDTLIYRGMDDDKLYVREYKEFFDEFVKFLDWENEKVSTNRESEKS